MILDKIIAEKKLEVAELKKSQHSLKEKLAEAGISLLAEIKKASPSRGIISPDFKPAEQLQDYQKAGAAGISILTDRKFFQGDEKILRELRKLTELPLLRKDFIIDKLQIYQSFFMGADVILLIAAVLSPAELHDFLALAKSLNLEAVVEVHSLEELKQVVKTDAEIIGINNRDLNDFTVDLQTTSELSSELEKMGRRDDYYLIAESGIKDKKDIDFLKKIGVDGVLIGEALMKAKSPAAEIKKLGIC